MTVERRASDEADVRLVRERALVRRMRRGDSAAIDEFCQTFFGRLYRFALRRLERPEDAEEVVQTVIANAARRIETFRGDASLFAWLTSICRREIHRFGVSARRRAGTLSLDGAADDDPIGALADRLSAPRGSEPDAASERREIADLIRECLDRMPERQAQVLIMKYVDGHSSREIAARLEVRDEAAQSLLARARRTFRALCHETLHEALTDDG